MADNSCDSDLESDLGASPSLSDSESSSVSSRASTPDGLRIVCEDGRASSSKKKGERALSTSTPTRSARTPTPKSLSKGKIRKPAVSKDKEMLFATPVKGKSVSGEESRKRKRCEMSYSSSNVSPDTPTRRKKQLSKRRRTKSERNSRAGKSVAVGEADGVALDAEIDKFLEEKAMKNNLTATNVKSIIRHVITNNMVQKMIMTTVKRRSGGVAGAADGSSDEDACFEPKLTRGRAKFLLETNKTLSSPPLWPLGTPAKPKAAVSETHVLIHDELPEDSSGDEEYVPKEDETHSEDENSSVASHASDAGSPKPGPSSSSRNRRRNGSALAGISQDDSSCFKTPPPKKNIKQKPDSVIGQRTRSKLPLNDTPLEDLEMQLIPPDITTDMYDWGISDNEDYLAFLKDFLRPGEGNEGGDSDDPEYNVMEEEEEHDKEELRRDKAVKVSKKELNELVAEYLEDSHFNTSGDELDEREFTSFCSSTANNDGRLNDSGVSVTEQPANIRLTPQPPDTSRSLVTPVLPISNELPAQGQEILRNIEKTQEDTEALNISLSQPSLESNDGSEIEVLNQSNSFQKQPIVAKVQPRQYVAPTHSLNTPVEEVMHESTNSYNVLAENSVHRSILEEQLRQHVQLLTQSYALTATRDGPVFKKISHMAKIMIIEIRNIRILYGAASVINNVSNCEAAWQFVNGWPYRTGGSRSPIKKKILVDQYMNQCNSQLAEDQKLFEHFFPRPVAKAIAECEACVYPSLLPSCYDQNSTKAASFLPSEDVLIIYGLEQIKDQKLSNKEAAALISSYLLSGRTAESVWHRIRNLKKKNAKNPQYVKDYFENGIVPKSTSSNQLASWDPDTAKAPINQNLNDLPRKWQKLINDVKKPNPSEFSDVLEKKTDRRRSKKNSHPKNPKMSSNDIKNDVCVKSTFPKGIGMVQQHIQNNPDLVAVPLNNANGAAEAYMFIPKYALSAYETAPLTSTTVISPSEAEKFYHTVPMYDRNALASNGNDAAIDLCTNREGVSSITFTPVGRPITIPGAESEVLDLSTLSTPLKKAIMLQVGEEPPTDDVTVESSLILSEPMPARSGHSARTFGSYESPKKTHISSTSGRDKSFRDSPVSHPKVNSCNQVYHMSHVEYEPTDSECISFPLEITLDDYDQEQRRHKKPTDADGDDVNQPSQQTQPDDPLKPSVQGSVTDTSNATFSYSSIRRGSNGDDDDQDEQNRKRLDKKAPGDMDNDISDKDEETEEDPEHPAAEKASVSNSSSRRPQKVTKRKNAKSSGSPPKKRPAKTTVPVDAMVEDNAERDTEVCEVFMQAFLGRVRTATEVKNPGLHADFIKVLADAGESGMSEKELLAKVKILLKDYPQLLAEFSTFIQVSEEGPEMSEESFQNEQSVQAQMNFFRHFEKYTEKSPQLKAKIIQKFKALKDRSSVTEKEVAEELAPFFQGNPVMMDAFKTLYPSVYLPGPVSSSMDFEEIDFESENLDEEPDVEVLTLPDEKAIPATTTCPCPCHENTTQHAYSSRMKHCCKCCIKFQDGKVFVHNSRVVRPVSVELMSPADARKFQEMQSMSLNTQNTSPHSRPATGNTDSTNAVEKDKAKTLEGVKCHSGTDYAADLEPMHGKETSHHQLPDPSNVRTAQGGNSTIVTLRPWTLDEDKLLLSTCQSEASTEDAFTKLESFLPNRDRTEIESRCVELISLLQHHTG